MALSTGNGRAEEEKSDFDSRLKSSELNRRERADGSSAMVEREREEKGRGTGSGLIFFSFSYQCNLFFWEVEKKTAKIKKKLSRVVYIFYSVFLIMSNCSAINVSFCCSERTSKIL